MKVLQVFNQYRSRFNGEQSVVEQTARLIEKHGGQARLLARDSDDIGGTLRGKVKAAWSGVYSRASYREMQHLLDQDRPHIVHAHNLYPLLSPSVLVACRRAGIPVVASVHNQQFTCPRSDHLYGGEICQRCLGGREYHCVLRNCRQNLFESVAYAARSMVARKLRLFHDNVSLFIALSHCARKRLVEGGYAADRIVVLPNMAQPSATPVDPAEGQYGLFAGRISPEKGIATLITAARGLPELPLCLAGDGPLLERLASDRPPNVTLLGRLDAARMSNVYRNARFLVLPSTTYEMCPLVVLEAMSHGIPVVTSRRGGQAELVRHGQTGLLFEPGDPRDLSRQMMRLWDDPALSRQLGSGGYAAVREHHSEQVYYQRLMAIYRRAMAMHGGPDQPLEPISSGTGDRCPAPAKPAAAPDTGTGWSVT